MDASKEIKRFRRWADDHEWQMKELRCRANALEKRDREYRECREKEGIPIIAIGWRERVRMLIARIQEPAQ